jgi:hypothetical protein
MGGAPVRLSQLPEGHTEARVWYRTDSWTGAWTFQLWVHRHAITTAGPVKVLEGTLDAGGVDGALIADDRWHEARGVLARAGEVDRIPPDDWVQTYIWLVPKSGWNVPHRTYVDRCELVCTGEFADQWPAPAPTRRVRPRPGHQTVGKGWIWIEGEDARSHDIPPNGAYRTDHAGQQEALSNGSWLQHHEWNDRQASWDVTVPEAGDYVLWGRGIAPEGNVRVLWDGEEWTALAESTGEFEDPVMVRDLGWWQMQVYWLRLGTVALTEGKHTLTLQGLPDAGGIAVDCWLLTTRPWSPNGAQKPGD